MTIKSLKETSYQGMYKIAFKEGSSFFIRKEYLKSIDFNKIDVDVEFSEQDSEELLDAGLVCVVELKAIEYLARAEQSRFGLSQKLLSKSFEKKYIEQALDFLESKNYLSDKRFASAWLNTRKINHYEGYTRLFSELLSRKINKEIAQECLKDFFTENSEEEICQKAIQKFQKKGKKEEKLLQALLQSGFSYKMIKKILYL